MSRKINLNFIVVITVSIFLTLFFTAFVSYQMFQQEVFSDLSSVAEWMDPGRLEEMKSSGYVRPENELRITWIAEDGMVLYDSYDQDTVGTSHADRPEVVQALKAGEGFCVRKSQTMERNIFFYAKKVSDHTVIRIAKYTGSIWKIYRNTLPAVIVTVIVSFAVSLWIARHLTKAFVKPIAQMADDMDHLGEVSSYKELAPLIELIRIRHEETVRKAKQRQEFTANISHELKTPLTAISGYAELIATGMASKKKSRHFAEEIHRNAARLLSLMNDILQLSELEDSFERKYDRDAFQTVDICELAKGCVDMMKPVAEKQDIFLDFKGTPLFIQADKNLIEELIYNLCDNAIRYNNKGGHVWVKVTDRLEISDDGIGISRKYQKLVFERFFRVDKSRSKKTGGTGLGLAIVKHIAQVHQAVISLESEEGMGTTIGVEFPQPVVT